MADLNVTTNQRKFAATSLSDARGLNQDRFGMVQAMKGKAKYCLRHSMTDILDRYALVWECTRRRSQLPLHLGNYLVWDAFCQDIQLPKRFLMRCLKGSAFCLQIGMVTAMENEIVIADVTKVEEELRFVSSLDQLDP